VAEHSPLPIPGGGSVRCIDPDLVKPSRGPPNSACHRLERARQRQSAPWTTQTLEFAAVLLYTLGCLTVDGPEPTWNNTEPLILPAYPPYHAFADPDPLKNAALQ